MCNSFSYLHAEITYNIEAHCKLWYVHTALYEAFALDVHMRARMSLL